jgi:hypothetical protein
MFMNIYLKRFTLCSFTVAIGPVLDEFRENDVDMRTISHYVKYLFERGVMRCTLFLTHSVVLTLYA